MKKILSLIAFSFVLISVLQAQIPPNAFNYSAVARNASGQPIATTTIGIQVTILKTSPTGASQYVENHFVNTDEFGLFNLIIGGGAVQSGSMSSIDWGSDNYFLKVGMDANGGTNFLTMGTTQLLSVPYALHAKSAETSSSVKMDTITSGISVDFNQALEINIYSNITSPLLQNESFDMSIKIYKNGVYFGLYAGSGTRLMGVPGDIVECKVFLQTFTGIKYYTQSYIVQ